MTASRKQFLKKESNENSSNEPVKVEPKKEEETEEKKQNSNPIVRAKQNMPEFIGTDERKYNLRNGDVLSLPADMSEMLSKRGAVERIEQ